MQATGEGVPDGKLNQGGSGPDSGYETATDRVYTLDAKAPFATPVNAEKRIEGEGEGEEAEEVTVGISQIQIFNSLAFTSKTNLILITTYISCKRF